MNNTANQNISNAGRIARVVVGTAMAVSVGIQSGALGVAAVLPLVAIYPMMTGVLGWDPMSYLVTRTKQRKANVPEIQTA